MQDILEQDITYLTGVGPHRREILSKELGIETFGDLLEYYPYKYVDRTKVYAIRELSADMPFVQIRGRVLSFEETQLSPRKSMLVAHFSDGHSVCDLVWFNGLKYFHFSIEVAPDARRNNDVDRIDTHCPDEQGGHHGNPKVCPPHLGTLGELERRCGNESHHRRTDAPEHGGYPWHIHEAVEKHCDEQDDEKRRQYSPQAGTERAWRLAQLVADEDADVGRKHTRTTLRHGNEVDELLLGNPLVFVHYLRLDDWYHGIATTQRESTNLEEGAE